MPYRDAILVWCTNCGTIRVYNAFKDCVCGHHANKELHLTLNDGVNPVFRIETE